MVREWYVKETTKTVLSGDEVKPTHRVWGEYNEHANQETMIYEDIKTHTCRVGTKEF